MRPKVLSVILFLMPFLVSACIGGPKSEANKYAERMPDTIGTFRLDDDPVELSAEAVSNTGHVTLNYEIRNSDNLAVVFNTYGSDSATDVAYESRLRDLRLTGAEFSTDSVVRYKALPRAEVAEMPGGRLAIFKGEKILIEVTYLKSEADSAISDEDWEAALNAVRDVAESLR